MFETCVKTLRKHSNCVIVVVTDNVPSETRHKLSRTYNIHWMVLNPGTMEHRRAACKIEQLDIFMQPREDGDCVLVSDVDIYFLADPFTAMGDFDVALTTRGYDYYFPINGGIFYLNVNDKSKEWISWHNKEVIKPTWPPYIQLNQHHRKRFGLDWAVGQDFLIACWEQREQIKQETGITIVDVGPKYNYCPPSDKWGTKAFEAIRKAYHEKSVVALHLKSTLKDMLYEGFLEDAITKYPKCSNDWYTVGKRT